MNDFRARVRASFARQQLMATFKASLVAVDEGEVQIELPFAPQLAQQHGYLHAGVVTAIVDSACGYAALTRAPEGREVVSAEFKVNFLRPALGDRFLAVGVARTAGHRLAVCTGDVRAFTESATAGTLVALMQATMAFVPSV